MLRGSAITVIGIVDDNWRFLSFFTKTINQRFDIFVCLQRCLKVVVVVGLIGEIVGLPAGTGSSLFARSCRHHGGVLVSGFCFCGCFAVENGG